MTHSTELPRRLALVVTPEPGESLPSWIDRLAEEMHRPPGLVVDDLGLRVMVDARRFVSLLFGVVAADEERAAVRAATGVSAEVFDAMHLSVYDGTVLDLSDLAADKVSPRRVQPREWALFTTSRACPDCLAESGGVWQLWWRLAAAAVCPTHRLVLASYCPGCRLELRGGTGKRHGFPSRQELVAPTLCANRIDRRMCRYPLTGLPRVPVGEEICDAQVAYLDAADGRPRPVAGRRIDAAEWSWVFRIVCGLARFAGQSIELPATVPPAAAQALVVDARRRALAQLGRQSGYRKKPRTALLATAMLGFAGPVLAAGSDDELRQALSPVGTAVAAGLGAQACAPLWRWRMPPFLRLALRSVFSTPRASWGWVSVHVPPAAGVDRSAGRAPRPGRTTTSNRPGAGGGLEFRHLPHLVAANDYQELVAPWLRAPAGLTGRRFTALALARLCGASSWADAGVALGWADGRARAVTEYARRFVVDPQNFWLAVTALADRLRQRGPVDYDRRRQALSTLTSIDTAVWRPVFAEHGARLPPATCRAAAAWLWAALTCGERTDAPALADPGWSAVSVKNRRRTCRNLSERLPSVLAAKLLAFGNALLDSHGVR